MSSSIMPEDHNGKALILEAVALTRLDTFPAGDWRPDFRADN